MLGVVDPPGLALPTLTTKINFGRSNTALRLLRPLYGRRYDFRPMHTKRMLDIEQKKNNTKDIKYT